MEVAIERVRTECIFVENEDVEEKPKGEPEGCRVETRVPPNGSTGGPVLVAVASDDDSSDETQNNDTHQNIFGLFDGDAHLARLWALYDEQLQEYLDHIRMASDFGGDVRMKQPTTPGGPRPCK